MTLRVITKSVPHESRMVIGHIGPGYSARSWPAAHQAAPLGVVDARSWQDIELCSKISRAPLGQAGELTSCAKGIICCCAIGLIQNDVKDMRITIAKTSSRPVV